MSFFSARFCWLPVPRLWQDIYTEGQLNSAHRETLQSGKRALLHTTKVFLHKVRQDIQDARIMQSTLLLGTQGHQLCVPDMCFHLYEAVQPDAPPKVDRQCCCRGLYDLEGDQLVDHVLLSCLLPATVNSNWCLSVMYGSTTYESVWWSHTALNCASQHYHVQVNTIHEGKLIRLALIDLSKAFDSIHHSMLISKLKMYGCASGTLKWFQ